jgi:hypothetical protein
MTEEPGRDNFGRRLIKGFWERGKGGHERLWNG